MKLLQRAIAAIAAFAILTFGLAVPANAHEGESLRDQAISRDGIVLDAEGLTARQIARLHPLGSEVIEFGSGSHVVIEPGARSSGMVTPQLTAGVGLGLYLYLNRTDQNALINGGLAGVALIACNIPAVGQFGCGVVTVALASAATYLTENGICPKRLQIHIHVYTTWKCVN